MNKNNDYLNFLGLSIFFEKIKTFFASKNEVNILNATVDENKNKLDGIAEGANNYIHPETSGNKHIPSGGSSGQILSWCGDGTAKWINHNTIDGITDSLTAADSNIALSAKAGNDLQNQISELNSEFSNLTPQDIDAFPYMVLPNDTDLNALTNPGVYRVWNEDETPYGGKAVLVIETDESYISQIAIEEGYSFSMSMRYYTPIDGWSDWVNLDETFLHRHAKADSAAYADDAAHAANADNATNSVVSASANAVIGVPFQNTDPGVDRRYHLAADGGTNPVQWIHRNNMCVGHLGNGGNADMPMTFHYVGKPGQPQWVWGSDEGAGTNAYVWNPAAFSVYYANTAHGIRAYNEEGASYGESWVMKCKYNMYTDGAFGLYVQHNGGGIMDVRVGRAAMDSQGRDIAATYLPVSGGNITGDININGNRLYLTHNSYIKSDNGTIRLAFNGAGGYPELVINGNYSGSAPELVREVRPSEDGTFNLGAGNFRWKQLYAASSAISTSDRKQKKNIKEIDIKYIELFNLLQPVSFQFQHGTSGRTHIGFISQDIESAMDSVGLTDLDFAGFCKDQEMTEVCGEDGNRHLEPVLDDDGNPVYIYSLRYEEFIALNTKMIQLQQNKIELLENKINNLEEKFSELTTYISTL